MHDEMTVRRDGCGEAGESSKSLYAGELSLMHALDDNAGGRAGNRWGMH